MKKLALVVVMLAFAGSLSFGQETPPAAGQQPPAAQAPKLPASPPGQAATQVGGKWAAPKEGAPPRYSGGKWIVIDYGRPILRGRPNIFGAPAAAAATKKAPPKATKKAPEPATTPAKYGEQVNAGAPVWRAGANLTTRLHTEVPLVFGGKTVDAGDYSMFVDLDNGKWTLILSNQPFQQKYDPKNKTDTWGSYNYDSKFDVIRVPMTVKAGTDSIDQFTIQFVNITDAGGTIAMLWEKTIATVPFKVG